MMILDIVAYCFDAWPPGTHGAHGSCNTRRDFVSWVYGPMQMHLEERRNRADLIKIFKMVAHSLCSLLVILLSHSRRSDNPRSESEAGQESLSL